MMYCRRGIVLLVCFGVLAAPAVRVAQADLIAYEGFDYSTGNLDGKNGGAGDWTGSWANLGGTVNVVNESMSYANGNVSVDGGTTALQHIGNNTPFASRAFEATSIDGQPLYFSMLIATSQSNFLEVYASNDKGTPTSTLDDYGMVLRPNSGTGTTQFGVRSGNGGSQNFVTDVDVATTASPNLDVHLAVIKWETEYRSATDDWLSTVSIFIDPDSAFSESTVHTATMTGGHRDRGRHQRHLLPFRRRYRDLLHRRTLHRHRMVGRGLRVARPNDLGRQRGRSPLVDRRQLDATGHVGADTQFQHRGRDQHRRHGSTQRSLRNGPGAGDERRPVGDLLRWRSVGARKRTVDGWYRSGGQRRFPGRR